MTIKDIAALAGVSISTVSRVISGKDEKCASKAVRERIWDIVSEHKYVPNPMAKNLRSNASNNAVTGVIYIYYAKNESSVSDSYFDTLCKVVMRECVKNGYVVGKRVKANNLDHFLSTHPNVSKKDGLIILGKHQKTPSRLLKLFGKRIVYVTLNKIDLDYDQIICDGKQAGLLAMSHLYENGHKKIAYIGQEYDEIRFLAYREFLQKNKLNLPSSYVLNCLMTSEGGYNASKIFVKLQDMPTAIFCANDETAIGVLQGLREANLKVPKDVSVISIDNIKNIEMIKPALTDVEIPLGELGAMAVKTLLDRISNGHKLPIILTMPSSLVKRESVSKV